MTLFFHPFLPDWFDLGLDEPLQASLCDMFRLLAYNTWYTVRDGNRFRSSVGEESITDNLMLALARHCRDNIVAHKFTKAQEKIVGADWEWWLKVKGLWVGMRVQAKRLEVGPQKYLYLDHRVKRKSGKPALQVDGLIKDARSPKDGGPRRIPLYCFYNFFDKKIESDSVDHQYGCAIASAYKVKPLIKANPVQRHRDHVLPFSFPWHQLVCRWEDASEILEKLVPNPAVRKTIRAVESSELPEYARRLAMGSNNALNKNALDDFDNQISTDLAGVLIIDPDRRR